MIKDAWEKADFSEIGAMVAEKINAALEGIDWAKIKEDSTEYRNIYKWLCRGIRLVSGRFYYWRGYQYRPDICKYSFNNNRLGTYRTITCNRPKFRRKCDRLAGGWLFGV